MRSPTGSDRGFQGKRFQHRRSSPTDPRLSHILLIIQKLNQSYELRFHRIKSPSKVSRQPFLFCLLPRSRDRELTMAREISVLSYAFAILLSMMGIAAGPAMDPRWRQAPSDQHGFSLR
jgi:hypothetical protein